MCFVEPPSAGCRSSLFVCQAKGWTQGSDQILARQTWDRCAGRKAKPIGAHLDWHGGGGEVELGGRVHLPVVRRQRAGQRRAVVDRAVAGVVVSVAAVVVDGLGLDERQLEGQLGHGRGPTTAARVVHLPVAAGLRVELVHHRAPHAFPPLVEVLLWPTSA